MLYNAHTHVVQFSAGLSPAEKHQVRGTSSWFTPSSARAEGCPLKGQRVVVHFRARGDPPLASRSNLDFYVDSGGVTGFHKIIKLVNNISINPGQKNIDLTEM